MADYESRYVTGNETINLDKGSFQASDLMIDPDSVITLPNSASFEDADITLGALPEISYNDRTIGTAYLLAKDGVTIDGNDSASEAATTAFDTANAEAPLATASNAEKPQRPHKHISVAGVLITILIVLLVLGVIGLISWFIYSKKKEAKALAKRRERRRQRLQRSGDEEEFERLLAEYKNKKK